MRPEREFVPPMAERRLIHPSAVRGTTRPVAFRGSHCSLWPLAKPERANRVESLRNILLRITHCLSRTFALDLANWIPVHARRLAVNTRANAQPESFADRRLSRRCCCSVDSGRRANNRCTAKLPSLHLAPIHTSSTLRCVQAQASLHSRRAGTPRSSSDVVRHRSLIHRTSPDGRPRDES
jgi:hypothetical protein